MPRQGFAYVTVTCGGSSSTALAGDLDGLIVGSWSWIAKQTGDARHLAQGDQVYAGTVRDACLVGTKQFDQAYTSSYLHLGGR
jgi:hypothetical protein